MHRDDLVAAVAEDLLAYVMNGQIEETPIAASLAPDGLGERFEDFDALVDLHFVLRPAVVDFIEQLPEQLRRLDTQTTQVQQTTRGAIEGRVDWSATMTTRLRQAPGDTSLFVASSRYEHYDTDENLVLKRLLSLIYHTLEECETYLRRDYRWITDRWRDNRDLVAQLRDIVERNVHVTRISDPASYEPTERMLTAAAQSRTAIYREAAELLRQHRQSRAGDPDALRSLLKRTLITPDDNETLFELFVLFRYIEALEAHADGNATVSTIESGRQAVARIDRETGPDVVLYHDSAVSDRDLTFGVAATDRPLEELSRSERVHRRAEAVVESYFEDVRMMGTSDRPDVIVLEIHRDDEYEYLITEVKYSTRPETIKRGAIETLEYLAFLRRKDERVFEADTPFGSGWNGVLVIQDLEDYETAAIDEQHAIRILQASELETALPVVLDRVLADDPPDQSMSND